MSTEAPSRTTAGIPAWVVPTVVIVASVGAMVIALLIGGGAWTPSPDGLPDSGPVVGWGLPLAQLAELLLGVVTVSQLAYAAILGPQGRDGVVSRQGRTALRRASAFAFAWAVVSALTAVLTLAYVLAIPLSEALTPNVLVTYIWDLAPSHSLLLTAIAALIVAIGAVLTTSTTVALGWLIIALIGVSFPAFNGHAAGLGDHALAITSGIVHQVAATLWLAGVVALVVAALNRERTLSATARRFSQLATWIVAVLVLSGILLTTTHLDSPGQLFKSGYGLIIVAKVVALVGLLVLANALRQRLQPTVDSSRWAFARLLLVEIGLLSVAMGLAVALARTPSPRTAIDLTTPAETLLGYPFPPPPTVTSIAFGWRPDALFLIGGLVVAALYLAGVWRLHRRGDSWPVGRLISWLAGIAVMIWATSSGIATYSPLSFSVHMMQHMTLAMMAPIFLVLGAPFTLALRAIKPSPTGGRGPREWIVWGLHSPVARFFTNPIYVMLVYTVGLYGLYYTSLFGTLMSSHLGHVLMSGHFLVAGYLFYWVIIGVDPLPRPLPYWGKLVMLLLSMVVHSFFALPIMSATTPIAAEWFASVQPPWLTDLVADTRLGGGIAWGFGEIPAFIVLVALSVQWARDDTKIARRRDRQVDRVGDHELDAYNERLARLAEADSAREAREKAKGR